MKGGRSMQRPHGHRDSLQGTPDVPDDWGEESWTVDCVCGVNFDDGEEMVNCDDCGVWVHTRCSRYVKGEDLFTCDKCKKRKNLTTRSNNPPNSSNCNDSSEETEVAQLLVELPTKTIKLEGNPAPLVTRRPFRLWTDTPMEDRVHVQGVPGGDPSLFSGLRSTVFTPALWKSTGYVPKKFCFQYREFPCWDEDNGVDAKDGENGAGVLFSLSKASGLRGRGTNEIKEASSWSPDVRGLKFGAKKERSLLRSVVSQSGKRKKEDASSRRDRNSRKKIRAVDREIMHDKRSLNTFKEDRGPRLSKGDTQIRKVGDSRNLGTSRVVLNMHGPSESKLDVVKHDTELIGSPMEATSVHIRRPALANGGERKGIDKPIDENSEAIGKIASDNVSASSPERHASFKSRVKLEREGKSCNVEDSVANDAKAPVKNPDCPSSDATEVDITAVRNDSGGDVLSLLHLNENYRVSSDVKPIITGIETAGIVSSTVHTQFRRKAFSSGDLSSKHHAALNKECCDGSSTRSEKEIKCEFTQLDRGEEKCQDLSSALKQNSVAGLVSGYQGGLPIEEASSSSFTAPICIKSSSLEELRCEEVANIESKSQYVSEATGKKHNPKGTCLKDSDKSNKEHCSPSTPASKASHSSKVAHAVSCWRTVSVSKDSPLVMSKEILTPHSSEAGEQQREYTASMHNKGAVRGDKSNPSNPQPPNKGNCLSLPSNSGSTGISTALSDEELALLLHQELNSSPRVPRVPRARAGILPQLNSPTTASMILKRSSFSWGKDHRSFSRRKTKDASKDAYRHLQEPDDGIRKLASKIPSSPDHRGHETGNLSSRKEDGSSFTGATSMKSKNSASTVNSGPSSSTEVNDTQQCSSFDSPRDVSDDDTGTASGPVHRTLPVLIHEIMSKGRRMTYEELCNAVLPHWNNLRKHNGERYAYSGPSQAVLDCLRNRQEWAQLVDRGPKTNLSRKRRRADADESDDNGHSKGETTKDEGKSLESPREDFPRGKRNARKRKLSQRGRVSKDSKKLQKSDSVSEDDSASFSDGPEKSHSSQYEVEGNEVETDGSQPSSEDDDCET